MPLNIALKIAFLGKRQVVIAKKLGIHESRLSQIVNGHREASLEEKRAIARELRQPIAHLFPAAPVKRAVAVDPPDERSA
jgi:DNA-binding transcriptional regulator YdaS (Cro superfamily)